MLARQPKEYFRMRLKNSAKSELFHHSASVTWCTANLGKEEERCQQRGTQRKKKGGEKFPHSQQVFLMHSKITSHFWVWLLFCWRPWKRQTIGGDRPPIARAAAGKHGKGNNGAMVPQRIMSLTIADLDMILPLDSEEMGQLYMWQSYRESALMDTKNVLSGLVFI